MKKAQFILSICLIIGMLSVGFAFASTKIAARSAAVVTKVTGNATAGGSKVTLRKIIRIGDRITTAGNTYLELTFSDGTRLRIGPNSDITLVRSSKGNNRIKPSAFVRVAKGKIWGKVQKGKRKLVTQGSTAVCAVMGTTFRMETTDNSTTAGVYDGSVGIRMPFTSDAEIDKGMESVPNLYEDKTQPENTGFGPPKEIPPPMKAIPGPQEISMEQWLQLVENQQIVINQGGQSVVTDINQKTETDDIWVKWNMTQDKEPLVPITIQGE